MNPEHETLGTVVIIMLSWGVGVSVGAFIMWYLRIFLKRSVPTDKQESATVSIVFSKAQTLVLARLWDAIGDNRSLPVVEFWQALDSMLPEEHRRAPTELKRTNPARWYVIIDKEYLGVPVCVPSIESTKEVVPEAPATADMTPHIKEAVDLLCSSVSIAARKGDKTNWDAFHVGLIACLKQFGRSGVTARTYREPAGYAVPTTDEAPK